MARSVQSIQNQILTTIANNSVLNQLTSPSQAAIFNLFAYIVSVSQNTEEVLNDQLVSLIENVVNVLAPATPNWIQQMAFDFQYSSANPQIIQFNTASNTWFYPTINPAYEVVTNCSVTPLNANGQQQVNILVAGGGTAGNGTPAPLGSQSVAALQTYFNTIKPAGIKYNVISNPPDNLYSVFTVYYQGVYSATIGQSLLTAYNNYLNNISFGGTIYLAQILAALLQVTGVTNVICNKMVARSFTQPFGAGVQMVISNDWLTTTYLTTSGYIVDESSPNDFLSNLIFKTS